MRLTRTRTRTRCRQRNGSLAEAKCDWGGYRCLCELGTEALPEYLQFAKASRALGEKQARLVRMQVATIFSLAVALPLLMDKRLSSLLQRSVTVVDSSLSEGNPAPNSTPTLTPTLTLTLTLTQVADSSLSGGYAHLRMHVGWAMVLLGFAPFSWQVVLGTWDAAQLGSWVSFAQSARGGPWWSR